MQDFVTGWLEKMDLAKPGEPLDPRATSVAIAIVGTELGEFWRLPLTLFLLPTLSRRVLGREPPPLASEAKPDTPPATENKLKGE
jgi:hypothetical protein